MQVKNNKKLGQGTKRGFTSLRFSSEFSSVKNSGKKFQTYNLVIWHKSNLPPLRLGITVSTKIDKKAVVRNRIKRIIRAAFMKFSQDYNLAGDYIIMARKNCSELTSQDIYKEFKKALK